MFIDIAAPVLFVALNIVVHVPAVISVLVYGMSEGTRRKLQHKRTSLEKFFGFVLVLLLFVGNFGASIFLITNFFITGAGVVEGGLLASLLARGGALLGVLGFIVLSAVVFFAIIYVTRTIAKDCSQFSF